MFIRLVRPEECREFLVNINHISLFEILYSRNGHQINAKVAAEDPDAERVFKFSVGGEVFHVPSDPNDPVTKVLDELYKNAVKG